jgi:fucose permease
MAKASGNTQGNPDDSVTIRRAPKFFPFLITGAVVGLLVAAIWFMAAGDSSSKDWASALALLLVVGLGLGGLVGVAAALVIERVLLARAKQSRVTQVER